MNYYDILGVSKTATDNEIKKAYRALSLQYHPDRNQTEEAKTKILQINEAYETLSDTTLKHAYDNKSNNNQINPDEMFSDMNNIFNMMFNGGNIPSNIKIFHNGHGPNIFHNQTFHFITKPKPIVVEAHISMNDSYNGCIFKLEIIRHVQNNSIENTTETEIIHINIPPGINTNETIIINDKGNIVNNIKGPIHLKIVVNNESVFIRENLNLIYNMKISLKEALCGFMYDIQHLNGNKINLNCNINSPVIKPGFNKIIQNLGMRRDNVCGNLIIKFDIEFPETLTEIQKNSLNSIL
jgi:DnaJ-class molecular chaperone